MYKKKEDQSDNVDDVDTKSDNNYNEDTKKENNDNINIQMNNIDSVSCDSEQIEKLEKRNDEKINELTEDIRRLQAEFENFRKRTERERCELIKTSSKSMLMKIIPIYDHFELALKNTANHEEFVKGVEMVKNQLFEMLREEGIEPIKCVGEKFDPLFHEALLTEESDRHDIIIEEFQKGYIMNGRVLKHSLVKVGKKKI